MLLILLLFVMGLFRSSVRQTSPTKLHKSHRKVFEAKISNLHLILQVVDGQNIIHTIEHVKRNYYDEKPLQDIVITNSGELPVKKPYLVSDHPYT